VKDFKFRNLWFLLWVSDFNRNHELQVTKEFVLAVERQVP